MTAWSWEKTGENRQTFTKVHLSTTVWICLACRTSGLAGQRAKLAGVARFAVCSAYPPVQQVRICLSERAPIHSLDFSMVSLWRGLAAASSPVVSFRKIDRNESRVVRNGGDDGKAAEEEDRTLLPFQPSPWASLLIDRQIRHQRLWTSQA